MRGKPAFTPESDAPILRVHLLGGFRVVLNGHTIPDNAWRRRKARQLFKCLLTRARRRLTKDEAIELFWPESDVDASSTNLRSTVHAIRQALEPAGPAFVAGLIVVDRDGVGVRRGADVWVDADAFEEAVTRAPTSEDPAALLEQANALYAGDYLPDDLYEDWAAERRDRLKRAWTELQLTLARLAEERGDPDRAATTLERLLQADACDERTGQELMRLFARQGRRTDAVRVYQRLVQALRDELEVEPSAATVELHHEVAAPGARPAPIPADRDRPGEPAPTCSYPFPSPTRFFGRREELARLERVVERGRSGSQAVVITGPAGAGKSALLGALVRRAEGSGVLCLAGGGYEQDGVVPFGPFHDALAAYLLARPAEQVAAELGVSASDLALVVPELRYHLGLAEPPRLDDPSTRPRLFAAVHAFLRSLATRGPVLLCLEDLHAADAASLELFGYLARQIAHPTRYLPLTLVGSYRMEGLIAGQPLSKLLARLSHDRQVELVKLPPLDRVGTARLAASLLEGPVSEPLGDWLHATSEGNPLFLEQLVLALREEGRLTDRAGVWHEVADQARVIPTIIRELIGQRVERLTGRCRETLAAAAVLGQTVQHDVLLDALAPREETSVLEDLAEALDAQLLHEAQSGYRFTHALIREAIYWGLSAPRRMLLHARAGELLERRGGPRAADHAAQLAHHFTFAGHSAPVRAKALRYSLEAGRTAAALSSYREALVHFGRACQVVERGDDLAEPAQRVEALAGRGRAERELARWPESMTSFREVLALSADPVQRVHARGMIAYALLHTGDVPRALAECDAGLIELGQVSGAEAAAARIYLQYLSALVWYLKGRYREVEHLAGQMSGVAASLGEPRSLFAAHSALGWAYMGQGKVSAALEEYARALAAAERGEDKIQVAIAQENLGYQSYLGGRLPAAREHLERALAIYRHSAGELRAVNALQHLCQVWVAQGELARAREQATIAVDLEVEGQERWAADGHHILGVVHARLADWEAAAASFEQALGIRRRVGDMPGLVASLVGAGLVDQYRGDWTRAADAYRQAVAQSEHMDPGQPTVCAYRQLGRLRLLIGDRAGAAEDIERALALAESMPETIEYAPTLLAAAELRFASGDLDGALHLAERSLASAAPLDQMLEARVLLARLCLALGRQPIASVQAAEAVVQAERLGSPHLLCLAHLASGRVAAAGGDPGAAEAAFELALRHAEDARTPYERALVLRAAAEQMDARGSLRGRAAAMRAEADRTLDRLGARVAEPVERARGTIASVSG
jgi:DNA-binding SARP family transcriptional activator/Tfp pilus assembly protein PilF